MHTVRFAGCVLAVSALVASCTDQPLSPEYTGAGGSGQVDKPLFSHAPPPSYSFLVDVNNYRLGFNSYGLRNLFDSPVDGSGTYRGTTKVLYAGSIAYGTSDKSVFFYNSRGGPESFKGTWPLYSPVDVFEPGSSADQQTVSVMLEAIDAEYQSRSPLGLVTVRETYAYSGPPDDDYIILKYTLLNPHDEDMTGLHLGQGLDLDVASASDDVVQYDAAKRLAFVTTAETDVVSGHVMLTGDVTTYQTWRNPSSPPGDLFPFDPPNLAGWYGLLSGGMAATGPWGPSDVRHFLAEGPVTIPANGSRVIAFALVAGDDLADLYVNADAAIAKWASLPAEATGPYSQPLTRLSIAPRVLNLAAPGVFSAVFEFASAAEAEQAEGVLCSGARPSRANKLIGRSIRAFFNTSDLNAELRNGDPIVCDGRLSDGTRFLGADAPTLLRAFTPVTQLTFDPADDVDPSWSPDGKSIVFASDRGRDPGDHAIWRMDIAAGEASAVQLTSTSGLQPDWSPDGSTIVWAGGHIFTVPADGGTPTALTEPPNGPDWYPRYSPDGTEIAFRREPGPEIWKMTAAGELVGPLAVPLATDGLWEDHPAWSPDGERIYFLSARPGANGFGIYTVDATTGEPAVRVTPDEEFGAHYSEPAPSPDGRTLAFLSGGTSAGASIILQDLRTGTHSAVLTDPPLPTWPFRNLEYSPDGKRLLFVSGGDIYIAEITRTL